MSTFKQIAFMIHDKLKLSSDDTFFEIDHLYFLMDHYRALLLHQRYTDAKKTIPEQNYQVVCMDIEYDHNCITGEQIRTVDELPALAHVNFSSNLKVHPSGDFFKGIEFTMVSRDRLPFVGNNKWLKKFIYFALAPDKRVYLKSGNVDFTYLSSIMISGVFDSPTEALELSCDNITGDDCDKYEQEYPLESDLIPVLIDMVYEGLVKQVYAPMDTVNNASDDMQGMG